MRIYLTDIPRNTEGSVQYAPTDLVDCIAFRKQKYAVKTGFGETEQIDGTLVSGRLMRDGQTLYFQDYDPLNADPNRRHAIFEVKSVSESTIGRNQYRLQFKEFHAS